MLASRTIRKLQSALNRRDAAGALELYAKRVRVTDPFDVGRERSRADLEFEIKTMIGSFPDLSVRFSNLVGYHNLRLPAGECVWAEARICGTHQPLLFATNKCVNLRGAVFWRLNYQGLIIEERRYYDVAGGFRQFGWKLPKRLVAGSRK